MSLLDPDDRKIRKDYPFGDEEDPEENEETKNWHSHIRRSKTHYNR